MSRRGGRRSPLGVVGVALTGDQTAAGLKLFSDGIRVGENSSPPGGVFGAKKTYANGLGVFATPYQDRLARDWVVSRGALSVSHRRHAHDILLEDHSSVTEKDVTGAVAASGLVRLTVTGHGYTTGDQVLVWAVAGTTEANGGWTITVVDANTIDLQGSTFANAYTSGGKMSDRSMMYGQYIGVKPRLDRNLAGAHVTTGAAANGDDITLFVAYNESDYGTFTVDEAFYAGHNAAFASTKPEFWAGLNVKANVNYGLKVSGNVIGGLLGAGLDTIAATFAASTPAIRMGNAQTFVGRNAAGNADLELLTLTSGNLVGVGGKLYVNPSTGQWTASATTNPWITMTADGIAGAIQWRSFNSTAANSGEVQWRRARGTAAAPLRVKTSDALGWINARGYFAADDVSAGAVGSISAEIKFNATEDYTATAQGGGFTMGVTQAGGTTVTNVLSITWPTASSKLATWADAMDFALGTATGLRIGTATAQKVAFHGSTPVIQRAGVAQVAVATTGATTLAFGYTTAAQADAIVTLLNEIRATLVEKGLMKGSS